MVNRKSTKLSMTWLSKLTVINTSHYRPKKILKNFTDEAKPIKTKFLKADWETFSLQFDEDKPFILIDTAFLCKERKSI